MMADRFDRKRPALQRGENKDGPKAVKTLYTTRLFQPPEDPP